MRHTLKTEQRKIMENKVLFKGVMDLGGMQIPCYVLDNGVRVLSGRGMQESLNRFKVIGNKFDKEGEK